MVGSLSVRLVLVLVAIVAIAGCSGQGDVVAPDSGNAWVADELLRLAKGGGDEVATLAAPVSITLGFHEGDWEEGSVLRQDALRPLFLDKLHLRFRGEGVRVAVLDTGVDPTHPHLAQRVEIDPANPLGSIEVAQGVDSDGDGLIDEAFGHGTHVAGIVATVAPDATILPIRVLDSDGVGTVSDIVMGLYEAVRQGANIVNLSLVLNGDESDIVHDALRIVEDAGVAIVGAAGNVAGPALYPASDSHVMGVAAVDGSGALTSFSASDDARLAAPGLAVLSSYPNGEMVYATGTSMSAAVVAGSLALVAQALGDLDLAEERLRETASPLLNQWAEDGVEDGIVSPHRALSVLRVRATELTPMEVRP